MVKARAPQLPIKLWISYSPMAAQQSPITVSRQDMCIVYHIFIGGLMPPKVGAIVQVHTHPLSNSVCMSMPKMLIIFFPLLCVVDSVEEGDKVVKTAIDNFGRIGTVLVHAYISMYICCTYTCAHMYVQCCIR